MTVYFARVVSTGQIKIGFTTREPTRRVAELRSMYDMQFDLLATQPGNRDVERKLHHRFAASRTGDEFFRPTADLLAHVAEHRIAPPAAPPALPWTPEIRARFRRFVDRWHSSAQPVRVKARHLRRWVLIADAQEAAA